MGTPYCSSWGEWGPIGSKKWVETVKITMPQNSNFRLPRAHRFRSKFDFTVKVPNHGWDPLGSILGSMGSHWVKKWVKSVKNYHAPEFKFSTTQQSLISAKIRLDGYGAKSRWGHPRVHLGANGSKKWVKTVKNYHAPKLEFSTTPFIDFDHNSTFLRL